MVRDEVDKVPLWRGQHLEIRQLLADFAKHLYLPRVTHSRVLLDAISEGVALANWEQDGFAYADGFDEEPGRYRGLSVMRLPVLDEMDGGLIVKPEAAIAQIKADAAKKEASATGDQSQPSAQGGDAPAPQAPGTTPATPDPSPAKKPSHFHASASLSATKLTPQVAKLSEEVIQHLASKLGVQVEITLDIQATLPEGFDPDTIRTVTENCRALKLDQSGFEDQ